MFWAGDRFTKTNRTMDILTPHDGVTNDKIAKAQIEAVERKQNEYKLIGQIVRVPGHTLYKFKYGYADSVESGSGGVGLFVAES